MFKQLLTGLVGGVLMALQVVHAQANFEMVSLTNEGLPPTILPAATSSQAAVTPDGRYVVFESSDTNLVTNPVVSTNTSQIYLRDRVALTTELISQSTAGIAANSNSTSRPTISNDGCRVVFLSYANNLIDGQPTATFHVFLRNRCTGGAPTTTMVDVMPDGSLSTGQAFEPRISGDGRTVAFSSNSLLVAGLQRHGSSSLCTGSAVYLRNINAGTTTALMRPDGGCILGREPDISYDGTRIAFFAGDILNKGVNVWQIYLYDTTIGPTSLSIVSADANGVPQRQNNGVNGGEGISTLTAPAISQDGRIVAFRSRGYGLWPSPLPVSGNSIVSQVYVKDTYTGAIDIASVDSSGTVLGNGDSSGSGAGNRPGLSSDGQYIVFRTSATNISSETSGFVLHNNFAGGTTGLTNLSTSGYPELSPSGRYLTIYSGVTMDASPQHAGRGMFLMDLGLPYAPSITKLTASGKKIKIDFTASAIPGAIPATNFGALCEGTDGSSGSITGPASPLTITTGLKPGVTYICRVHATNANGTSAFSSMVTKKLNVDLTPILMLLLD